MEMEKIRGGSESIIRIDYTQSHTRVQCSVPTGCFVLVCLGEPHGLVPLATIPARINRLFLVSTVRDWPHPTQATSARCGTGAEHACSASRPARSQHGRITETARSQHGRSTDAARTQHVPFVSDFTTPG